MSFKRSIDILSDGFQILKKYPIMFLPVFMSWILYAIIVIYFSYYFDWNIVSGNKTLLVVFLILLGFCVIFSVSSFIMLEFIEQIETNQKIDIGNALRKTFEKDFLKAFPIMLVWAFIWFLLVIIKVLTTSKDKNKRSRKRPSLSNFAKTLSGYKKFSLTNLTLDLINSSVRLVVFTIYPAIAWEDEATLNAVKKGFCAIKNNAYVFISGFVQTEVIIGILLTPIAILFGISEKMEIDFSQTVWVFVIIYIAISTTLYLYLQQMLAAILYMWNMKWVKAVQQAQTDGTEVPEIQDVKRPDLLDNIPDLLI